MNIKNIINAWKNESFRRNLTAEERAMVPQNPAGFIELADADLEAAAGGALLGSPYTCTRSVCNFTRKACPCIVITK